MHARVVQVLASNGFTARYDWEGVYAAASSRMPRDVRGRTLPVRFAIVDKRPLPKNATRGPYRVGVSLQVGLDDTLSPTVLPCQGSALAGLCSGGRVCHVAGRGAGGDECWG